MKKVNNKSMIIITIILLSLVVISLIIFLIAALKGNVGYNLGLINFNSESNLIIDRTFENENINEINIKQDAGEIIFKESENQNIKVEIYGNDKNVVDIVLEEDVLSIDYTHQKAFSIFSFGTPKNDIIVYIPSNHEIKINLENDYGECEMVDLENAEVNIDCDAGDVKLGKIKNAIIYCDYGNIEIDEILNKCNIEANCGNIEINKISITENSSIIADMGNVEIEQTNDIYINGNCDMGSVNINENNRNSEIELKIESNCGNITVNN